MSTVNISLTQEQSEYVRRSVEREFGNISEFFRNLLRDHMRREIEADVRFLQSTADRAVAGPSEAQINEVLRIQKEVRKELKSASGL